MLTWALLFFMFWNEINGIGSQICSSKVSCLIKQQIYPQVSQNKTQLHWIFFEKISVKMPKKHLFTAVLTCERTNAEGSSQLRSMSLRLGTRHPLFLQNDTMAPLWGPYTFLAMPSVANYQNYFCQLKMCHTRLVGLQRRYYGKKLFAEMYTV